MFVRLQHFKSMPTVRSLLKSAGLFRKHTINKKEKPLKRAINSKYYLIKRENNAIMQVVEKYG